MMQILNYLDVNYNKSIEFSSWFKKMLEQIEELQKFKEINNF